MNTITTGRIRSLSYSTLAIALIALPLTAGISANADEAPQLPPAAEVIEVPDAPQPVLPPVAEVTEAAAPVANPDIYTTPMNTPLVVAALGLLANDSYPLGSVIDSDDLTGEIVVAADGSFTYTPPIGFVGTKTFNYQMSDFAVDSNWALVTISVTPVAPVGMPDAYSTPMDTVLTVPANGVLANDSGALAVIDLKDQPVGLTANFDGSFSYTPPAGFVGDVGFSYRMSVGSDMLSDWIPVTITVTPIASLPTLANTGVVTPALLAPALALLALGASGIWLSTRRRQQSAL